MNVIVWPTEIDRSEAPSDSDVMRSRHVEYFRAEFTWSYRSWSLATSHTPNSWAFQPALGRAADLWGYPAAFLISSLVQLAALPLLALARRTRAPSDTIEG